MLYFIAVMVGGWFVFRFLDDVHNIYLQGQRQEAQRRAEHEAEQRRQERQAEREAAAEALQQKRAENKERWDDLRYARSIAQTNPEEAMRILRALGYNYNSKGERQ